MGYALHHFQISCLQYCTHYILNTTTKNKLTIVTWTLTYQKRGLAIQELPAACSGDTLQSKAVQTKLTI